MSHQIFHINVVRYASTNRKTKLLGGLAKDSNPLLEIDRHFNSISSAGNIQIVNFNLTVRIRTICWLYLYLYFFSFYSAEIKHSNVENLQL